MGLQIGIATIVNSIKVPQKLKTELTHDPAITLLGIYTKKTERLIQTDLSPLCSLKHYLQ